jgi:hypothetical protein
MKFNEFLPEEKVRLDPKCWTGKQIGKPKTKMKGGVRVNNCVPAESVNEMDKSQTPPGRDGSNDPDAGKKEYTAKTITPKKVVKHAEKILNKELNKKLGMAEGSQRVDSLVTDALKIMRGSEVSDAIQALKTVLGDREFSSRRGFYNFFIRQMMDMYGQQGVSEGAKVDRMVKHVAKSEKKLGHSKKEAENIAWATANKRGMLDNKNKKK